LVQADKKEKKERKIEKGRREEEDTDTSSCNN